MATLDDLHALRHQLAAATKQEFDKFWDRFFTLAEQPAFRALGEPYQNDDVRNQALLTAAAILRKNQVRAEGLMVRIAEANMIHGFFTVEGKHMTLVCFPDLMMGTVAMSLGGGQMMYARFSITPESMTKKAM